MNDFVTQDIPAIAAPITPNMDANVTTVYPMAELQMLDAQIANAMGKVPTPQPEIQAQQPITDAVKSKQQERRDLSALVDIVRCLSESHGASVINNEYGVIYKGTFDVRFDNPDEVTPKTLNAFLSKGVVLFFPDDINDYPSLKKFSKPDGGINLSVLLTRKKRPANLNEAEWTSFMAMWAAISTVLHAKGIDPIYTVFTEALRSFGYGGPKINRKLGGGLESVQSTQAPMEDVLKKLISLLQGLTK